MYMYNDVKKNDIYFADYKLLTIYNLCCEPHNSEVGTRGGATVSIACIRLASLVLGVKKMLGI